MILESIKAQRINAFLHLASGVTEREQIYFNIRALGSIPLLAAWSLCSIIKAAAYDFSSLFFFLMQVVKESSPENM